MSIRTYCVIPHCAREDTNFFQGVFEDGVRVLYQGRLQSLLFSHVLSPAHDYVKHIDGPLLAALREGGCATMILVTPNSEAVSTSMASQPPAAGVDMSEITSTVMGLYAQLFPLLFRSVEGCASVRVSVVTVSASEKVLLDNLQEDRRLRSIAEAQRLVVHRRTSATEWGTLLRLLEDRHVAMEASATSLAGQTACVVTVEMEGYGRLVVVDAASAQELLQQLTLILGMEAEGDERTYPLHTPLRDLLSSSVPPRATVQVVCLPAPRETVRQTMRVLHFGSAIEAWRSGSRANHIRSPSMRASGGASALYRPSDASKASTHSKHFTRPSTATGASPSVSFEATPTRPYHVKDEADAAYDDIHETNDMVHSRGFPGVASSTPRRPQDSADGVGDPNTSGNKESASSEPVLQRYVTPDASSVLAVHQRPQDQSTPAQLPPPSVTTTASQQGHQRAQEEKLRRQVTVLEAQIRDLKSNDHVLRMARDDAVRERERVELELRSKSSLWADLQRAHNKAKQENADYAQLVQKLLQQVRILEKDTSRQKRQDMTVVRELRQVREEKTELEIQLTRLRKEVMLFRRDATYRAREATLSRIVPSELSVPPQGTPAVARRGTHQQQQHPVPQSGMSSAASSVLGGRGRGRGAATSLSAQQRGSSSRSSPRARRLYDSSTDDDHHAQGGGGEDEDGAVAASNVAYRIDEATARRSAGRVTDITLEELRWRNRHLEQEVVRLQERLLRVLAEGGSPSTACPLCAVMQERVDYFQKELAHVRDEKDHLIHLLRSPTTAARAALESEDTASQASTVEGRGDPGKKRGAVDDAAALRRSSSSMRQEDATTHAVVAALLSGCASLQAQLECAQSVLEQRLRRSPSPHAFSSRTDPLSFVSSRVLAEHHEAVAALAESLQRIADKPATIAAPHISPSAVGVAESREPSMELQSRLLPPVPRSATAGNVETLTGHLTFEAERCRHLRAFVPTFAQLAVATEHLLLRLETTEPES